MSKFKIGDRVVVISDCTFTQKENGFSKFHTFTITKHLGPHNFTWKFDIYGYKGLEIPYTDEELELEEIFHSPLSKALT